MKKKATITLKKTLSSKKHIKTISNNSKTVDKGNIELPALDSPSSNFNSQATQILPKIPTNLNDTKEIARKQISMNEKTIEKDIASKTPKNAEKQHSQKIIRTLSPEKREFRTEKEIALDFATKTQRKFDLMIKSSILFGSQAKDVASPTSDIDIIFIIDDASISWDLELISWYREELAKLIALQSYGKDLHINTIKLTTWWQDLLRGDPVVVNILRYGEALIDSGGFFNPIKALLLQGRIRSTPEAVYAALQRSPAHLARSKAAEISAIEGVYWTMVDAAQAALMTAGKLPPSPEHIPDLLKETFVDSGMLKINYVRAIRDLYSLHKSITHGQTKSIKGIELDNWQKTAESFLSEITRIIDYLIENKERSKI